MMAVLTTIADFVRAHLPRCLTVTETNASAQGRTARRAGILRNHNPFAGYKEHEARAVEWDRGWEEEDQR